MQQEVAKEFPQLEKEAVRIIAKERVVAEIEKSKIQMLEDALERAYSTVRTREGMHQKAMRLIDEQQVIINDLKDKLEQGKL